MTPLDKITSGATTGLAGVVDRLSRRLGGGDRVRDGVTRRGVLAGAAVAGSALVVDPKAYALTPQTAYSTICGPGSHSWDGWTVFCCTVNGGNNSCPPGSFAAGWWKAAGSSWCCGGYQYIVDCNAKCTGCTYGCSDGICDRSCWNCSCGSGSTATCDQRRHCCNAFRYGQCNTQIGCSGGVNCRVLSCVPPYKWANCTTTSLVDNRTAEHGAPCLEGCGPILTKYNGLGGHGSWLKASRGPERSVGDGRGRYVAYQGGWIYWTSKTGAHTVNPAVKAAWDAAGGPQGALRYPTADRVSTGTAWTQRFEGGLVCDSSATPVCSVSGSIFTRWVATGRETGGLGYPAANAVTTSGGTYQVFQRGAIADPAGPGGPYAVYSDLWPVWAALTGTRGVLGWPTYEQVRIDGGVGQNFSGGAIVRKDGAASGYAVRTLMLNRWLIEGGSRGKYGFPVENTRVNPDGTFVQRFEHGTLTTS